MIHGLGCNKAQHTHGGHLHCESDDSPYVVDGAHYCGRCHIWISSAEAEALTELFRLRAWIEWIHHSAWHGNKPLDGTRRLCESALAGHPPPSEAQKGEESDGG